MLKVCFKKAWHKRCKVITFFVLVAVLKVVGYLTNNVDFLQLCVTCVLAITVPICALLEQWFIVKYKL